MLPTHRKPKKAKPPRIVKVSWRCKPHLRWVAEHDCSACGCVGTEGNPIEAAHISIGTPSGMGIKAPDRWVVSLCHNCHHADQHQKGERSFWKKHGVEDPKALATLFAQRSPHWLKLRTMP